MTSEDWRRESEWDAKSKSLVEKSSWSVESRLFESESESEFESEFESESEYEFELKSEFKIIHISKPKIFAQLQPKPKGNRNSSCNNSRNRRRCSYRSLEIKGDFGESDRSWIRIYIEIPMQILWKFWSSEICSTSPPGGNQVDGLPPVRHFSGNSDFSLVGLVIFWNLMHSFLSILIISIFPWVIFMRVISPA